MHRRDFFKKAGAGVAVAAIAPLALADVPHGTIPAPAAPEDVDAAWIELMWREEPPQYGTVNSLADDEMRRIQLEAAERIVNTPIFLHLDGTRDYAGEELARKVDAEILAALK